MRRTPVTLLAAALAVLPHEVAHALPARAAGLSVEVTLLPEWAGSGTPLGRFDAAIDETTPRPLVRLVAVAPWLCFVGLALLLDALVALPRPLAVLAVVALSLWASLSPGDLAVATRPDAAREAGRFVAPAARWTRPLADGLTVATVVGLGLLLLR
jgi:hypothetical protein